MFLKNLSYMFIANVLSQLLVMATLTIALRKLGVQNWEVVVIAQVVINNVLWIVGQGFHFSGTVAVSQSNSLKKKARILNAVVLIQIMLLFVSLLILYLLGAWTDKFINFHIIINSLILALGYIFSLQWFLTGQSMFNFLAFVKISPKIILLIFILSEPFLLTGESYIYYMSISELLVAIVIFYALWRDGYVRAERLSFIFIKNIFVKSFKYFVVQSVPNLKETLIKIMIGSFLPVGALAFYSVAEKLKGAGITFFQPILHVSFPKVASLLKSSKEEYAKFLIRIIILQVLVGAFSAAIFYIFRFEIVEIFAGVEFIRSAELLQVWAISIMTVPLIDVILNHVLVANNRTTSYFVALSSYSVVVTSFVAVAIWWQSLQAVVTGIAIGDFIFAIALVLYMFKTKKLSQK